MSWRRIAVIAFVALVLGETAAIAWTLSETNEARAEIRAAKKSADALKDELAELEDDIQETEERVATEKDRREELTTELRDVRTITEDVGSSPSPATCETRDGHFTPDDAAQCVIYAWQINDFSIVPDEMASPEVFTALTAEPIDPTSLSFVGCTDEGQDAGGFTRVKCDFEPPDRNDTVQLYASGTPSSGFPIVEVGFYNNPPGYAPVD